MNLSTPSLLILVIAELVSFSKTLTPIPFLATRYRQSIKSIKMILKISKDIITFVRLGVRIGTLNNMAVCMAMNGVELLWADSFLLNGEIGFKLWRGLVASIKYRANSRDINGSSWLWDSVGF